MSKRHGSNAIKRLTSVIKPSSVTKAVSRKRIIVDFASKNDLVYFGYVNQRTDEHKLVRGLTASPTHRDNHYCIGSVENYDIILVERESEVTHPGKPPESTTWLILSIDLRQNKDLPHVFFDAGPRNEVFYANLFTKFAKLRQMDFLTHSNHSHEFLENYKTFAPADRILDVERLFTPEVTSNLGEHFKPLDIEIEGDTLYLYADNLPLTPSLLDAMLKNGLWLADKLDADDPSVILD